LDDLLHGPGGDAARSQMGAVEEHLALEPVAQIPARLEAPQERADARILERMPRMERFPDLLRGRRALRPEELQDPLLELGGRVPRDVTLCHVTLCNTNDGRGARSFSVGRETTYEPPSSCLGAQYQSRATRLAATSALRRLALLPDRAALLNLLDVLRGRRHLARRTA